MNARLLNLVERIMTMDKKIREVMLDSVFNRSLIIGSVIFIGMFGGYWIGRSSPSILELAPKAILLIGVGMGLFIGYVIGFARGIMRVIHVTQKEDVFLPTGKLIFDKTKG